MDQATNIHNTLRAINDNNRKQKRLINACLDDLRSISGLSLVSVPLGRDINNIAADIMRIEDILKKWV